MAMNMIENRVSRVKAVSKLFSLLEIVRRVSRAGPVPKLFPLVERGTVRNVIMRRVQDFNIDDRDAE